MKNKGTPRLPQALGLILTLAAILALGWAAPAPAHSTIVDEIDMVVDQDAMTKGELKEAIDAYFDALKMNTPPEDSPHYQEAKKAVEDGFIREVLLAEEADREKIEISDGEVDHQVDEEFSNMKRGFPSEEAFDLQLKKEGITEDDLKQDIHDKVLRRMKANRVLQMKQHELPASVIVTDDEVRKYFDQHPQDYAQARFSIILLRTSDNAKPSHVAAVEKDAQGLLQQLRGGADFAAMARKYSEDTASAERGGDVGTHYRGDLDPQLAQGVFALPVHGLGLVKTKDGIYIVKVEKKGISDYDSVALDIQDKLRRQKQDSAFNQWMDGLRKNAYIVVEGKEVAFKETAPPSPGETNPGPSPSPAPSPAGSNATPTTQAETAPTPSPAATPALVKKGLYPTLPPAGGFTLELSGEGFNFGSEDLSAYYGPVTNTNQSFPFGLGLHLGFNYAVDPILQVGVNAQGFVKLGESVNFPNFSENWGASAAGPGVQGELLIPVDESTNFMLKVGGGYYFLTGASVSISGSAVTESATFSGSNFGGEAGGGIEFFLDDQKDSTFDLEVGYRYLKIQPLNSNFIVNSGGPINSFPSPLLNADGSQSFIDFSGLHVDFGVRFYLDKEGS